MLLEKLGFRDILTVGGGGPSCFGGEDGEGQEEEIDAVTDSIGDCRGFGLVRFGCICFKERVSAVLGSVFETEWRFP